MDYDADDIALANHPVPVVLNFRNVQTIIALVNERTSKLPDLVEDGIVSVSEATIEALDLGSILSALKRAIE